MNEKPTGAQFDHCVTVYSEMKNQAREEKLGEPPNQESALVYEGHLTKLFASLNLAMPYYTSVMAHLKTMGCVEQLRRGGGNSPSRWRLLRDPEEEAFRSIEQMKRARSGKVAAVAQQVRDLTALVLKLQTTAQVLDDRVRRLERQSSSMQVEIPRGTAVLIHDGEN